MTISHTILFRRSSNLNLDYYINTHMQMTERACGPSVPISWECFRFPDENGEFVAEMTAVWSNLEDFQKVLGTAAGAELLADLPNYSDEKPIVLLRERITGSGI